MGSLSSLRAVPAGTAWNCSASRGVLAPGRSREWTTWLALNRLSLFSPRRAGGYRVELQEQFFLKRLSPFSPRRAGGYRRGLLNQSVAKRLHCEVFRPG